MDRTNEFDWTATSCEEQMRHARAASTIARDRIMREYDWSLHPEVVLGWLSAQKGIGLGSALSAFFNGDPWRFNYLPKRDVSAEYRGVASLLDSICQRINAGFYLPDLAPMCPQNMNKLDAWVTNQRHDLRDHRRGRWVIESEVLDPLFASKRAAIEEELRRERALQAKAAEAEKAGAASKSFSLKKLVKPLAG
ncbi:hypothetical protein [Marimonas arenosa]|uniref:Uncharacterized protein n=1 Tax=Marimonas arenosa TaxID=1795305 RepID=A0AAE3WAQ1_9RHOB|nr:hypothetical protein [Marimonas arenosa]MDQ2089159.1 hypothetical protein [Marimonas arenosa]